MIFITGRRASPLHCTAERCNEPPQSEIRNPQLKTADLLSLHSLRIRPSCYAHSTPTNRLRSALLTGKSNELPTDYGTNTRRKPKGLEPLKGGILICPRPPTPDGGYTVFTKLAKFLRFYYPKVSPGKSSPKNSFELSIPFQRFGTFERVVSNLSQASNTKRQVRYSPNWRSSFAFTTRRFRQENPRQKIHLS
jgi:hypothetical protein